MRAPDRTAYVLLGALFLLRAFATWWPDPRLWGIDFAADLPIPLRIGSLVLLAGLLFPPVGAAVVRSLERLMRAVPAKLLLAGCCAATALILLLLRSRNLMLGDAQTYVSSIEKGMRAAGGAHREPLAQGIVTAFHAIAGKPLRLGGQWSFTAIEMVLAVCAVLLAIRIAKRIGGSFEGALFVFSAVLLGGALQLFSGYAEFYGFALVAILLFADLGLRRIEENGSRMPAAIAFALAALTHAQALFAAPALIYLLAIGWRNGRRKDALFAAMSVPVVAVLGLVLLRYPFGEIGREAARAGSFLPPFGVVTKRTAYGAFSLPHLIDLLNVAILIAPALPIAIAMGLRGTGKAGRPAEAGITGGGGRVGADGESRGRFLLLLAIGPFFFALIANPQLGMARDWDIFVLPVTLVSLWAGSRALPRLGMPASRGRAIVGAVVAMTAIHGLLWLSANHAPDAARERMRRIATNESHFGPQSLAEVWRYIGSADYSAGSLESASRSYRTAIAADPDDRMSYRLLAGIEISRAAVNGKGPEDGLAAYHAILDGGGRQRHAYALLGGAIGALNAKRDDLALQEARAMVAAEPDHPELNAFWGDLLRRDRQFEPARAAYQAAIARDPSQPRARIGLACLAGASGDRATCEAEARDALRRTPWSPQAQQFVRLLGESGALTPDLCRRYLFIQ